MSGTYNPISTTRILGAFQRVTSSVGNTGAGVYNVSPDAGSDGVGVRGIITSGGNSYICIRCKFLLEPEG